MNIDVSKCEYYNDYHKTCNNYDCEDKPYCNAKELKCSYYIRNLENQIQQLKAEVKSKTEYIQEQRDIINQYSKEIEMYKKCQGKRASKREEQLKAKNEELKEKIKTYEKMFDNEEFRVALTDIRTGERELWQKYKPRMIKAEQYLDEIDEVLKDFIFTDIKLFRIKNIIKQAKDNKNV